VATATDTPIEIRAQAKWVRMSARKARLAFTSRAAAVDIERVLRSAVANAEAVHALDGDELVVVAAYADEGPTLKRWRARARGRVNRIRKRTCHITIVVAEAPKSDRPRPQRAAKTEATAPAGDAPAAEDKPKRRSPAKKKEGATA
jgi:large subunit ribosomal protein L22